MSVKRRKMGMSRKERLYRSIALMSAFFMLISCFTLVVTLVMDIIGFNYFESEEGPRKYYISFWTEDRFLNGMEYTRGEKILKPGDPRHSEDEYFAYTFRGWDITGDNRPDIIPNHAYFGFDAVAVYQKRQIKPLPKSSSEPEESSEPDLSSALIIDFNEVGNYGA